MRVFCRSSRVAPSCFEPVTKPRFDGTAKGNYQYRTISTRIPWFQREYLGFNENTLVSTRIWRRLITATLPKISNRAKVLTGLTFGRQSTHLAELIFGRGLDEHRFSGKYTCDSKLVDTLAVHRKAKLLRIKSGQAFQCPFSRHFDSLALRPMKHQKPFRSTNDIEDSLDFLIRKKIFRLIHSHLSQCP